MNSDYIPRLRQELLRAGASTQTHRLPARTRRALRPLAAAVPIAAVALIALALVLALPGSDERPVEPADGPVAVTYRVEPSEAVDETAQVLRERLAAAGVDGAGVSVSSGATLTITAPTTVTALTQPGRVAFYDWERSVLGPDGAPAPRDPSVTGGPDAGRAAAVTEAEAEARGGRVVRAEDGGGWFALGGEPALTNADIAGAEPSVDEATQQPSVAIELTPRGQEAFTALTRELAQRGANLAEPGPAGATEAMQHLAIVIDDRIVSVPYVDFLVAPDGIDGAGGAQIAGDLTPQTAREVASIVDSGPLPATLTRE